MKFIISETGEERELHYYRPSICEDMADDLIGNSGAVGDYIHPVEGANAYSISQEDFDWWDRYIDMAGRYEDQLDMLREQYGIDAVADVVARLGLGLGPDYTAHEQEYQDMIESIRDELGEDSNEA